MNKTIKITQQNIFEGEMANPQNCAIARAIKRNMKGKLMSVSVLPSHVTLNINNNIKKKEYMHTGKTYDLKEYSYTNSKNIIPVFRLEEKKPPERISTRPKRYEE
jgi:hypothetical protein